MFSEKQKIIIKYIQNKPGCTYREIKKDTRLKVERYFRSLKEAYSIAKVPFSKNLTKRNIEEQKHQVISYIQKNPSCSIDDIRFNLQINVNRIFGTIKNAFEQAKIQYDRSYTTGVVNPEVTKAARNYEKRVVRILSRTGAVLPQYRIKNKIIDAIYFGRKGRFVIEIKHMNSRNNITMSQIKQLLEYMNLINSTKGLIICPKSSFPKQKNKRKLYIEGKMIQILSIEDLSGAMV